jgi:hypothetical protein
VYLEIQNPIQRLDRITSRAQASVAEELAQTTAKATARLSETIVPAPIEIDVDRAERPGERRRSQRFATGSQIHARRIPGVNFEVPLDNVSAGGCRLEMIEECEEGEDVIARFPDLEPLGAQVRWTLGPTAGVQFTRPIHPAVLGSLLQRLSSQPNG